MVNRTCGVGVGVGVVVECHKFATFVRVEGLYSRLQNSLANGRGDHAPRSIYELSRHYYHCIYINLKLSDSCIVGFKAY
jgi:hypothetical protein